MNDWLGTTSPYVLSAAKKGHVYALLEIKQLLAARHGAEEAFEHYRQSLGLPHCDDLQLKPIRVVYPEDMPFIEQVRLLRNAQYVVGPEGSAMFLLFFARPGTKLCILNHTYTVHLPVLAGLL